MTPEQTRIFRSGSTTFYNSTRFFPRPIREKVFRLYALVRVVDNFVDSVPQQGAAFLAFRDQFYVDRITGYSKNLIIRDFVTLEKECGFNEEWANAFFDSMQMDLTQKTYATERELDKYTFGAAQVIGLFMAKIMSLPFEAMDSAKDLGRAFQQINFVRDIAEDLTFGRTYIAQSDLELYGLKTLDLTETIKNPRAFYDLVHHELGLFETYLEHAKAGFRYLPRSVRVAVMTASDMYEWTAAQISKDPFVIYKTKVKPPKSLVRWSGLKNIVLSIRKYK